MALINCPDCNKQVSNNAPTCPGCGARIATDKESTGSGVQQLQTIQETSKQLKLQTLYSGLLIAAGAFGVFAAEPGSGGATVAAVVAGVGVLWYIATRYRIWWHHK